MGMLIANRFSIVWRWFQLLGVFQSFGIGFSFGATNETSSPPVLRVYCKAKHSAFKSAKKRTYEGVRGKISFDHRTIFFGCTKFTRSSWIAHFAVDILLLRHYKSDLAHLSDFDSLVNGLSKSEI